MKNATEVVHLKFMHTKMAVNEGFFTFLHYCLAYSLHLHNYLLILLKNGDRAAADLLAQAKAEVDFDFLWVTHQVY